MTTLVSKNAQLKVWWIPQIPGKPFEVEVASVQDGVRLMDILAEYDNFQFKNNIKPDYANVGGIQMLENGEWIDWYDDEMGTDDPYEWVENHSL